MADTTYGLHTTADLMATTVNGMDVSKLSREEIRNMIDARLAVRNAAIGFMMGQLSQPTQARGMLIGQHSATGEWDHATEQTRGERRKVSGLTAAGFPIFKFHRRSGWTREYLAKASPVDLLIFFEDLMQGHMATNYGNALRALFNPTAYDWTDALFPEDGTIKVVPLVTSGGGFTPPPWQGNEFDDTHEHFMATGDGNFTQTNLVNLVTNVREHGYGVSTGVGGFGGRIVVWVSTDEEDNVRAHTDFVAANDPIVIDANKEFAAGIDSDQYIGYNKTARCFIRVMPFMPSGYVLAFATTTLGDGAVNRWAPLRRRIPTTPALQGIQRIQESKYPLVESFWEDYFGYGVANRISAAVMKLAASYTAPTIET